MFMGYIFDSFYQLFETLVFVSQNKKFDDEASYGSIAPSSGIFSQLRNIDEVEQSLIQKLVSITIWFMKLPYKITKRMCCLPFKLFSELLDVFIVMALNKVNHSKESASTSIGKVATTSVSRLKQLCIFSTLILIIFSISMGFSASLYVGIYYYTIPAGLS